MEAGSATTIVIMGVSGSGKSTVMSELERRLGWPSAEADEFMPPANVQKMRSGHPLTDEDRWPWLQALAGWVGDREAARESAIMTCSALRRPYRDLLRDGHPSVWFVELDVPPGELARRLQHRTGHYMPASLLASQLDTLEPLDADEPGLHVAADRPAEIVADDILAALARDRPAAVPASATARGTAAGTAAGAHPVKTAGDDG
jgi:gluconokinase